MPPHIGIGDVARRQREQAEHQDSDKNPARFQKRIHLHWMIPQPEHKVESAGLQISR